MILEKLVPTPEPLSEASTGPADPPSPLPRPFANTNAGRITVDEEVREISTIYVDELFDDL